MLMLTPSPKYAQTDSYFAKNLGLTIQVLFGSEFKGPLISPSPLRKIADLSPRF